VAARRGWILAAFTVASIATAESAAARGELTQLSGRQGCFQAAPRLAEAVRRCTPIRGLKRGNFDVQFARGGRTVYITADSGIAVFDRDTRSGSLRQLDGPAGCLTLRARAGCASAGIAAPADAWLGGPLITPDGQHAYVTWGRVEDEGGGIAALSVDALTGGLSPLPGPGGCLRTDGGAPCAPLRELTDGPLLTISPDGRHVYGSGYYDRTLAIFQRDPATGGLTQLPGAAGCISKRRTADCTRLSEPFLISRVSFSADGRDVYAATGRDCSGEDQPCRPGSVLAFSRNRRTGMLSQPRGRARCYRHRGRGNCTPARGVYDVNEATLTANGRYVYTYGLDGLAVFRRDRRTGRLTQLRGRAGCLQATGRDGCARLHGIRTPSGFDLSPDGRRAYVGTTFNDKAIGIFRRTRRGRLVQLPGRQGCVSRPRRDGCARARISNNPYEVHIAPDGRHAYVDGSFTVAAFAVHD
jgi:hypothetical protein